MQGGYLVSLRKKLTLVPQFYGHRHSGRHVGSVGPLFSSNMWRVRGSGRLLRARHGLAAMVGSRGLSSDRKVAAGCIIGNEILTGKVQDVNTFTMGTMPSLGADHFPQLENFFCCLDRIAYPCVLFLLTHAALSLICGKGLSTTPNISVTLLIYRQ